MSWKCNMFCGQGGSFKPQNTVWCSLFLCRVQSIKTKWQESRGALFEVRCVIRENDKFIWNSPGTGLSSWNFGLGFLLLIFQWIFAGILLLLMYKMLIDWSDWTNQCYCVCCIEEVLRVLFMNAMIRFSSPQNTEAADLLKYFSLGAQLCLTCSLVTVGQLPVEVHQPLQSWNSSQTA